MMVMYKYTFVLNTGQTDHIVGDNFQNILKDYFQWRGNDILTGSTIQTIEVSGYPKTKSSPYHISSKLIEKILSSLMKQNAGLIPTKKIVPQFIVARDTNKQQELCKDMKETCPAGSKEVDPILMYEDWCDDIPYPEFVKNDKYLSECYRLTNIINSFKANLEAEKNDAPMPQWPRDPFHTTSIPPQRLIKLYEQAKKANIDIPEVFTKFINAMNEGLFNVDVAMKGQYIGLTDQINPQYMEEFIQPAVEVLFPKNPSTNVQAQEEKDLQMAIHLSEKFGYQ